MVEGGMKCIKLLLFGFNLIFVLAAIGLIAVGAYVQIKLKDYFELIEGSFSSAAALCIAVGVIIFFIAVFGCCGAFKENYCCTMIFAVLLVVIFVLEIAAGIAGFVLRGRVEGFVEDYMDKTLKNNNKVWNEVQKDFKCCGVKNYTDWIDANMTVPSACCDKNAKTCDPKTTPPTGIYKDACLPKFTTWLEDKIYIIGAVGIALAFIQIVGILFACCLGRAIKKEYEVV